MSRGKDGELLAGSAIVFRMCYKNLLNHVYVSRGSGALAMAFAEAFVLSTADKNQSPPYLSVYEESLTTFKEGKQLTGGKDMVLRLPVVDIRGLKNPSGYTLNVCWFLAQIPVNGSFAADNRPGSIGHCGITGLSRPPKLPHLDWKWFRVRLADIAVKMGPVTVS